MMMRWNHMEIEHFFLKLLRKNIYSGNVQCRRFLDRIRYQEEKKK